MNDQLPETSEILLESPPRPETPPVRSGFLVVLFVLSVMAGLVYGGPYIAWRIGNAYESGRATAAMEALKSLPEETGDLNRLSILFRMAQQAVAPAVANIRSASAEFAPNGRIFSNNKGLGSGVVIDSKNGFIVTNHHVIKDADLIFIRVGQSGEIPARIIGTDPQTDLAVLKVGAELSSQASWGDSDKTDIGDWVLAIGSPFALERTVTAGIISAKNRTNLGLVNNDAFEDFLQTDAPINPGNSGGPLINLKGEIIGINTAIFSENGGNQGIGLAIPSKLAKRIVDQIIKNGKVVRGFFGVQITSISGDIAKEFNVPDGSGAIIALVLPDSPAAKAGLKAGDIITRLNGANVLDASKLRVEIASLDVGSNVDVEYIRDGAKANAKVIVGEYNRFSLIPIDSLGFNLRDQKLDPGREDSPTVLIIDQVIPGSPAFFSGLRPGMQVLAVGKSKVSSKKEFETEAGRFQPNEGIPIELIPPGGEPVIVILRTGR